MNPSLTLELARVVRYICHITFAFYILIIGGTALIREENLRWCWPKWRRKKERAALEFSAHTLPHERGCSANPFGYQDKDTWDDFRARGVCIVLNKRLRHRSVQKRMS